MSTVTNKPRLADKYKQEVVPALMKKFSYKTVMQAPKLTKICLITRQQRCRSAFYLLQLRSHRDSNISW